jgi:hypothetical protein
MDPLSALGIAGNVIQFVSFASDLVFKTVEIYHSAGGLSKEALNLETVYTKLQDLSSGLESSTSFVRVDGGLGKEVAALRQLSKSSKADCDLLLTVICKLRVQDGRKKAWKSFRAALHAIWKGREIANLEERLKRTQITMTLEVCSISRYVLTISSI